MDLKRYKISDAIIRVATLAISGGLIFFAVVYVLKEPEMIRTVPRTQLLGFAIYALSCLYLFISTLIPTSEYASTLYLEKTLPACLLSLAYLLDYLYSKGLKGYAGKPEITGKLFTHSDEVFYASALLALLLVILAIVEYAVSSKLKPKVKPVRFMLLELMLFFALFAIALKYMTHNYYIYNDELFTKRNIKASYPMLIFIGLTVVLYMRFQFTRYWLIMLAVIGFLFSSIAVDTMYLFFFGAAAFLYSLILGRRRACPECNTIYGKKVLALKQLPLGPGEDRTFYASGTLSQLRRDYTIEDSSEYLGSGDTFVRAKVRRRNPLRTYQLYCICKRCEHNWVQMKYSTRGIHPF